MLVKKRRSRPAPAVRLGAEMGATVVLHDANKWHSTAGGEFVLDDLHAAPVGHFVFRTGAMGERQLALLPAVSAEQLRHPLHVPRWPGPAEPAIHERVCPLVEQEMPAVIVARLVVKPELRALRKAVRKWGQAVVIQPRAL